jgi:hypothetical protein
MINSIFENLVNEDSGTEYYHLSEKDYGKTVEFAPRDPGVSGESDIPRICVAPTVEGALVALGGYLDENSVISIYELTGDPRMVPADVSVLDRKVTEEMWVLDTSVFEKVGNVPMEDIPDDLWRRLRSLNIGTFEDVHKQGEIKEELEQYVSLTPGVAEAIDEDDEDDNLRTVPAPMNFDKARAKNK